MILLISSMWRAVARAEGKGRAIRKTERGRGCVSMSRIIDQSAQSSSPRIRALQVSLRSWALHLDVEYQHLCTRMWISLSLIVWMDTRISMIPAHRQQTSSNSIVPLPGPLPACCPFVAYPFEVYCTNKVDVRHVPAALRLSTEMQGNCPQHQLCAS